MTTTANYRGKFFSTIEVIYEMTSTQYKKQQQIAYFVIYSHQQVHK